MKETGVIIDYNGYNGIIETKLKEKYILLKEEIVSDEVLKKLDEVMFVADNRKYDEEEYKIARFVRKLNNNSNKNNSHYNKFYY